MMTFLLMLAAGVAVQGEASAAKTRQCEFKVEQVSASTGTVKFEPGRDAPMLLSAVEKRVNGCSVLTEAGTGRTIEPPAVTNGPAKVKPAQ